MSTPDAPDALDRILNVQRWWRRYEGTDYEEADGSSTFSELAAARAIVAALRERAGALERLEAWMRAAPRDHFVYMATIEDGGEAVVFGVFDGPFSQKEGRGDSLALAITQALEQAERAVGGATKE